MPTLADLPEGTKAKNRCELCLETHTFWLNTPASCVGAARLLLLAIAFVACGCTVPETVFDSRRKHTIADVNVLPNEATRVRLEIQADETGAPDKTSEFINANFVSGYHTAKRYIAAQGPLPNTMDDFWCDPTTIASSSPCAHARARA